MISDEQLHEMGLRLDEMACCKSCRHCAALAATLRKYVVAEKKQRRENRQMQAALEERRAERD